MSSEQQFQDASDIRGAAQDYKRDAAQKQKWSNAHLEDKHHRLLHKPKPVRTSRSVSRHCPKVTVGKIRSDLRTPTHNVNSGHPTHSNTSEESSDVSADEDHEPTHSIGDSLPRLPTSGELILNTALARAIEQYEDKETTKLVKKEWELVDEDHGEDLGLSPAKKPWSGAKGTVIPAEDQEYEFV